MGPGGRGGAVVLPHLLGYCHGGCMCRRDVATSVCDTADFLSLQFFALLSGGDGGDD